MEYGNLILNNKVIIKDIDVTDEYCMVLPKGAEIYIRVPFDMISWISPNMLLKDIRT